jgi:NAD(P)-dependent dehydrogenase (short-subunit alcohol dehydrogenase family)
MEQALTQVPGNSSGVTIDLNSESAIQRFFENSGPFDHLVYTAGENLNLDRISNTEITQARQFFDLRYWGALAAIKYGAPQLNPGGSISLTSGTAALRPGAGWALAASICGAIEGLVKAMAVELAPLRVNCVVPGVIKTSLWDSMSENDRQDMYDYYVNQLLVKRVGQAEDVALGFLYLIRQSFGTGQSLVIDGGTLLV